ncbi:TetR/AcrR family transcriptional regulator [Conexibacter sp. JD483]|uniref:TetR/AcrR family transcriptional regulator n=1 Tax=unclassified Conexibacter TaxID=2627773 RepID=UPI0027283965|nr:MULTISPECIES: TetR/AcrR family transcriptional regulator [unclassified Conexibacter]MDO8185510.1 TetR/AcrR family transcriptional regulator [Conexibacter sp. CPCC 205706]MDO8197303.1 TetR/AcrR family transcriptional regulator [Conexibacter sp. CPCC 205762]MDR9370197.1 TetR/AcrR family transcriptional regulator [Conexibacter sp. JD483]
MEDETVRLYAELWAHVEPESSRRLLLAALDAFADRGFEAATTRDISKRAGMSPAAVYVHYRSKVEMLHEIMRIGHESVLEEARAAMDAQQTPSQRTAAFVTAFSTWHARFATLGQVTAHELRALPPERFAEILALRQATERLIADEIRRGADSGELRVDDLQGTVRAILSLGVDSARWYAPQRGGDPESIGRLHADLVLRMLR